MSRTKFAAISMAALALAIGTPALAAQDSDQGIVVTVAKGTPLKKMDVSTTVLRRDEVEASPETAPDQMVNKIPGIFTTQEPVAQLHPTGGTFSIRGFGTTTNVNTLVLLDGVPMNDPFFRTVDWNQVTKGQIEAIEVVRGGGATSLWGNLAMGGIVNIVTRAPEPGHMDVDLSAGSFGTVSGTVTGGIALAKNAVLGLSYAQTDTNGYNPTPEIYRNAFMTAPSSRNTDLDANLDLTLSDRTRLAFDYLWHRIDENGLIWDVAHNRWETSRFSIRGDSKLDDQSRLSTVFWYGEGAMDTVNASESPSYSLTNPAPAVPYVSQTETMTYHQLGGSIVYQTRYGQVDDIKLGVDGRTIDANDPINFLTLTGPSGAILSHAQHHFEGVFAQGTWAPPFVPMTVTLGLREDFWETSDGSYQGAYKGVSFASSLPHQAYSHFDPRLGVKYRLGDAFALRGAVYSNFAAPGMNQMYRAFIGGVNFTTANPDLHPQTNQGEEIGFDAGKGPFTLSGTLYTNSLKHFIDYATVQSGCAAGNDYCGTGISTIAGGSLRQYVNAGNATFRGGELLGAWTVGAFRLHAGYTYTQAFLTSSQYMTPSAGVIPDPVHQQIGQVPRWIADGGVTWTPVASLQLTLGVKSFPAYWNNTSHTQYNDGATILDVGATWRLSPALELYGSVQNAGNVRYYDQGLAVTTTNGSTLSPSTIPTLGMPLWATLGLRAHF